MRFVLSPLKAQAMVDDPQRTEYAQQAFEFSDLFAYKFARQIYGAQRARRLRLTEPDGPSTAGGRQARQPLVLVPDNGDGNMVLGWVDTTHRQAEIRSFDALKNQFKARFARPIDMERGAYDRLCNDLESFLKIQRIEIRRADDAPKVSSLPNNTTDVAFSDGSLALVASVFLAGMLIGLGLGYALFKG
ncbi:MAG: hypothetical protein AAFN74_00180 [Myxococcota bacterium]